MYYRTTLVLITKDPPSATLTDYLAAVPAEATQVKIHTTAMVVGSTISIHVCFHDEPVAKRCEPIRDITLSKPPAKTAVELIR